MLRMERHGELLREREKVERMRLGIATSRLMQMWAAEGTRVMPWDVFSELAPEQWQDDEDDDDDTPTMIGGDPSIVMAKLQAIAARQKRIAEA